MHPSPSGLSDILPDGCVLEQGTLYVSMSRMSWPQLQVPAVQGVPAKQYDAFDMGITTTDVFGAADVLYERTLPAVNAALTLAPAGQPHVPVVTGFLGRGVNTGACSPDRPMSTGCRLVAIGARDRHMYASMYMKCGWPVFQ